MERDADCHFCGKECEGRHDTGLIVRGLIRRHLRYNLNCICQADLKMLSLSRDSGGVGYVSVSKWYAHIAQDRLAHSSLRASGSSYLMMALELS